MKKILVASAMLAPLALAACAGGGGSSAPATTTTTAGATTTTPPTTVTTPPVTTPTPANFDPATVGATAPTTPAAGAQLAAAGGPSFDGSSGAIPTAGTVFAVTQTAFQVSKTSYGTDATANAGGGTATLVDVAAHKIEVKLPGLGIDATVTTSPSFTPAFTSLPNGNTFGVGIGIEMSYALLGDWQVRDSTTTSLLERGMFIAGYQTPPTAMPKTGAASYTNGAVLGTAFFPVGTNVAANLTGNSTFAMYDMQGKASFSVDFASGGVTGSLTNLVLGTNSANGPQPSFNDIAVSANIASNLVSGTTSSAKINNTALNATASAVGTIRGGFYGPNADNLAAVWTLSDGAVRATGVVGAARTPSDRRLKRDIQLLATLENGLRLYRYRYLTDDRWFTGVIAQDLLQDARSAAAVTVRSSGLMVVDYAMLGLDPPDIGAMREAGYAAIAAYEAQVAA